MSGADLVEGLGEGMVGDPDGFQRLWTPHRMVYIDSNHADQPPQPTSCPFCGMEDRTDEESLVVYRGSTVFVILNLFPYNPGHLLVCPYRHVADYTALSEEEVREVADHTRTAMRVTRAVSHPDGFNLGVNQGAVAGAGVAAHFHQHVVPRWSGDSNFFPIVARTKAIPQLLSDTRSRLADAWSRHE